MATFYNAPPLHSLTLITSIELSPSMNHFSRKPTLRQGLAPHKSEIVCEGAYELKLALPSAGAKKESGHFHADGTFHTGEH